MDKKTIKHVVTSGSWNTQPLGTDGAADEYDMLMEKFKPQLIRLNQRITKGFTQPDDNDFNLWPSATGQVVWLMQHNFPLSKQAKRAVVTWCLDAKNDSTTGKDTASFKKQVTKFLDEVKRYKIQMTKFTSKIIFKDWAEEILRDGEKVQ